MTELWEEPRKSCSNVNGLTHCMELSLESSLILFKGKIIFHCMDIVWFIYSFPINSHLDSMQYLLLQKIQEWITYIYIYMSSYRCTKTPMDSIPKVELLDQRIYAFEILTDITKFPSNLSYYSNKWKCLFT